MMGKVIMSGIVPPLVAPVTGILAGDLSVGSSVYLMENGVAVEYLVVNQGIPSGSSLYDASCDGTWLLRKDIYENRAWHSSNTNDYENSTIHTYLNGDFYNLLGDIEHSTIKQVKLPYRKGSGTSSAVTSGASGLSAKVFLLSGCEVGWTSSTVTYFPNDGSCLSYFNGASTVDSKRSAYISGTGVFWWLRTPTVNYPGSNRIILVNVGGGYEINNIPTNLYGVRPALVLPSHALFDTNTLILKGVA